MIVGTVSRSGVPTIPLAVAGRNYLAVIDTGFNGDLELPTSLRRAVNARLVGRATSLLAGGATIDEDLYLVDFPFDRRTMKAEATFVPGKEILIGTHLLRGYRLSVNFATRKVRITRIAK